ncbi:MAG: PIN domain-containing protein [Thermoleophilia bacterium]|nr:PIN domain-containing protein [Thermoleophilia bacterium]
MPRLCYHPSMAVAPRVYVVDTNALLNDPEVINSFSGAEVVVPAVVLQELDKLKQRRTDARVRYHGRKATRLLFEVSRNGRLLDGVRLENGSLLRVDSTSEFPDAPPGLDLRRTDDKILALAYEVNREPGVRATVVTNDLNMLLRAEALGMYAYRFEGKLDHLRVRRRTPMEWLREEGLAAFLGLLVVVLAAATIYLYANRPAQSALADLPVVDDAVVLQALGISPEKLREHYESRLQSNPDDVEALANLGNLASTQGEYLESVEYYRRVLQLRPSDTNVRTDMGITLLRLGHYEEAVDAFRQAIADAPDHPLAHYNLGVALAQGGDKAEAVSELREAVRLAQEGLGLVPIADAEALIAEIQGQ